MRILLLTHVYPPSVGGTEVIVSSLAGMLKQRGHSVTVVCPSTTVDQPLLESRDNMSVIRYWRRRWRLPIAMLDRILNRVCAATGFAAGLTALSCILLLRRPAVVHMHLPVFAEFFLIHHLRKLYRFRLVVSFHGGEMAGCEPAAPSPRLRRLQNLLSSANAVTAVSEKLAEQICDLNGQRDARWHIVPNGIRSALQSRLTFAHVRPFILGAGRLETIKGFDVLLSAFAMAELAHYDLLIAGTGSESNALRALAEHLNITDRVFFQGQCNPEELQAIMEASEFVVVPSRSEGFGLVALEAMALGRPIVATNVGGLPDLVPSPPNVLASPTVDSLAHSIHAMATLISDPFATDNIRSINIAKAKGYSLERMTDLYERTYWEGCAP